MQNFQGIGKLKEKGPFATWRSSKMFSLPQWSWRLFLLCLIEVGNGEILEKQHSFLFLMHCLVSTSRAHLGNSLSVTRNTRIQKCVRYRSWIVILKRTEESKQHSSFYKRCLFLIIHKHDSSHDQRFSSGFIPELELSILKTPMSWILCLLRIEI